MTGFFYDWPRPAVTVDVAVFGVVGSHNALRLQVLLVRRGEEPFAGAWALPGGFVRPAEDLRAAAARELAEETGLADVVFEQVAAVGTPGRDPRGDTVTVVWSALVRGGARPLRATGDAREAAWFDLGAEPGLAFDHAALLRQALDHLRGRLGESPAWLELLPSEFTLSELQALTEVVLGRPLDIRNFRRRALEVGFLEETGGTRREGAHRPARLYRFVAEGFRRHRERARLLPF